MVLPDQEQKYFFAICLGRIKLLKEDGKRGKKMDDIMVGFISKVQEFLQTILPLSPFRPYIDKINLTGYMGYINYFIPVGIMVDILGAWITCMGLFYLYSIIMRWAKIVGE